MSRPDLRQHSTHLLCTRRLPVLPTAARNTLRPHLKRSERGFDATMGALHVLLPANDAIDRNYPLPLDLTGPSAAPCAPTEVLEMIFQHLSTESQDIRTKIRLMTEIGLVCKAWMSAVEAVAVDILPLDPLDPRPSPTLIRPKVPAQSCSRSSTRAASSPCNVSPKTKARLKTPRRSTNPVRARTSPARALLTQRKTNSRLRSRQAKPRYRQRPQTLLSRSLPIRPTSEKSWPPREPT